ncbi:glycosyltransferase [Marinobacter alexandrii]|uniref:glycosyltransferase n=1 Tax=Marinobacter alexandrii TaxID=2570351 RepID=UPI0032979E9A
MPLKSILVVSPGPVDGYPPVQYQARILADAGHKVVLVTTPLKPEETETAFAHPNVEIRCVSTVGSTPVRMLRFAQALWNERRRLTRDVIEISYDPIGILYSDLVPWRPMRRVAHLHELLQDLDQFRERRLKRSMHRFDAVVVPDVGRAALTQEMLGLAEKPLVVENYPLRAPNPLASSSADKSKFEVVYCGSLGKHQRLDSIIGSVPNWPSHVDLVLIGNDTTAIGRQLKALAKSMGLADRVRFLGWMDTPAAERRIAQADLGIALLDSQLEQFRTALGASNKRYQIMKAGLPQIGDTNPGVPELLHGIGACVDANTHDPADIAAIVTEYAADADRCAKEGARAFLRHQEVYNYELAFRRLQEQIAGW